VKDSLSVLPRRAISRASVSRSVGKLTLTRVLDGGEFARQPLAEPLDITFSNGGENLGIGVAKLQAIRDNLIREEISLVEDHKASHLSRQDLREDLLDRTHLLFVGRMARVDYVDDQIGLTDFEQLSRGRRQPDGGEASG